MTPSTRDEQTNRAIQHLENALSDLRETVLPVNPERYHMMSEPALEMLWKLGVRLQEKEHKMGLSHQDEERNRLLVCIAKQLEDLTRAVASLAYHVERIADNSYDPESPDIEKNRD